MSAQLRRVSGPADRKKYTSLFTASGGWNIPLVRVRRLTTGDERLAKRILGGTLAGSGWAFAMKIRLQDVLDLDGLTDSEWSLYTIGHFDFVVCRSSDDMPAFALEVDGLSHNDPRQVKLDIIKNRLCASAGLPLLRLRADSLDEAEQISVLEWLLERFVSWQEQGTDYRADRLSPIVHDIFYPFPGNLALTTRLFNAFGIAAGMNNFDIFRNVKVFEHHWLVQASETFGDKAPYQLAVEWPGQLPTFEDSPVSEFAVSKVDVELRTRAATNATLFRATGQARFAWAHKTDSGAAVPPHALIPSPAQVKALGLFVPGLPWLDASAVAQELAIYDALSRVERWAASGSLRPTGLRPPA